jgi:chromatin modification-related protein VID21
MRTDFREERKWKMALAYNLSTAVLEWHAAGSLEERVRKRICVLWKRPRNEQMDGDEVETEKDDGFEQMDVDDNAEDEAIPNPMVDYNSSDNDDDEADPERKDVTDALDLSTVLQEALEDVDAAVLEDGDQRGGVQDRHVEPKVEERDDLSALRSTGLNGPDDSMDVDGATQQDSPPNGNGEDSISKSEEDSGPSATPGLKPTSSDPMLASIAHLPSGDTEVLSNVKAAYKPNVYAPMRERIVYSDTRTNYLSIWMIMTALSGISQVYPPETL